MSRFSKRVHSLDKRIVAILFAITSEAARFASVATAFTALTNSVGTAHSNWLPKSVNFEQLRNLYFRQWAKPPDEVMVPGKVYHFRKSGILLAHGKRAGQK